MATPVRPARGLVAAYPFDAGSGTTAADASGNGNAGGIAGATWTRGRYGRALEFDGERAIVRVEPSASLDVGRAMTLSGWIRPSTWQSGWRTIVQRQTDAYLLTASSNRHSRFGLLDDIRAALVVAAMIWLGLLIAAGGGGGRTALLRSWWLPLGLFLAGCLIDAAIAPSASLVGPALVAAWLAATASTRVETAGFVIAAAALTALTIAWLGDPAEAGEGLTRADGAIARSVALGALLVVAGAVRLGRRRTRSRSAVRGQRRSP